MSDKPQSLPVQQLLQEITTANLYSKLVAQLQKDMLRAEVDHILKDNITPTNLVVELQNLILEMVQGDFNQYLNLLYMVDVSETEMKKGGTKDIYEIVEQATYLILKREWKKVYYRNML